MILVDKALLDFRNFLFVSWKAVGLPAPTKVQYEMADVLQNILKPLLGLPVDPQFKENYPSLWDHAKDAPVDRVSIQAFRGVGKSWTTSALTDWALAIRPDLNIVATSASKIKSDEFTLFAIRLIDEMPFIHALKPDPKKRQRFSNQAFDVGPAPPSQAPSVRSQGIFGQVTGGRADIFIADDVEVPNTSETQTMREKLSSRTKELGGAILKPGGVGIYLGTPQCEDTLYTDLEQRGYKRVVWPARYPDPAWMKSNGYALAPTLARELEEDPSLATNGGLDGRAGKPTDPERFNDVELQAREAEYGRSGFSLQFMLDTSLSDADRYPLKLSDLTVMDLDATVGPEHPVWATGPDLVWKELPCVGFRGDRYHRPMTIKGEMKPYTGTLMAIDPAGRGEDELSFAVVKHLNGFLYLMECRGFKGGYTPENLKQLANRAKHWGVNRVVVEPNYGGGMFNELLKPVFASIHPCLIEDAEWSTAQKERRIIETIEPVINQHRLVVNRQVIVEDCKGHANEAADKSLSRQLFHQMTRITRDRGSLKHDDRLDALAIAIATWSTSMAVNADKKIHDREMRDFDKRIEEMRESRVRVKHKGVRPVKPSFLTKLFGK